MNALNPLVIIPARGGSKGLPRKNILPLAGRPLIGYTIEVARELWDDSRIILSTDDEEIATVGESCGLSVPYRRPAALATDTAGSREVILDAMEWAESHGIEYDCVILLQPTSPLRTVDDVRHAMGLYTPEVDMVVSVCEAQSNPYYNCFETDDKGYLHISKGDGSFSRRQDAPKAYEYNGAIYVINPDAIKRGQLGSFKKVVPSSMPEERSIDIDTAFDLKVAELLLEENK